MTQITFPDAVRFSILENAVALSLMLKKQTKHFSMFCKALDLTIAMEVIYVNFRGHPWSKEKVPIFFFLIFDHFFSIFYPLSPKRNMVISQKLALKLKLTHFTWYGKTHTERPLIIFVDTKHRKNVVFEKMLPSLIHPLKMGPHNMIIQDLRTQFLCKS